MGPVLTGRLEMNGARPEREQGHRRPQDLPQRPLPGVALRHRSSLAALDK